MFKQLALVITIFLSLETFGRTYIQCRSLTTNDDLMVVNLNNNQSTLFLTNGVHRPDEFRMVKNIFLTKQGETHSIYTSEVINKTKEILEIPHNAIENYNNNFQITLNIEKVDGSISRVMEFSCFNNIFND